MNSATALLVLSGAATALCGSLGAYASSNASSEQPTSTDAFVEDDRDRDELCITNQTDAIVYYDVMWGSERRSYSIGPGMRDVHRGSTLVSPFVEFTDGQLPETAPHHVKVAARGCGEAAYAFRYPTSARLRRQGGIYLFGAGIESKQYVRNDAETEFDAIRRQQAAWARERRDLFGEHYRYDEFAAIEPYQEDVVAPDSSPSGSPAARVRVGYGAETAQPAVITPASAAPRDPVLVNVPPPSASLAPTETSGQAPGVIAVAANASGTLPQ